MWPLLSSKFTKITLVAVFASLVSVSSILIAKTETYTIEKLVNSVVSETDAPTPSQPPSLDDPEHEIPDIPDEVLEQVLTHLKGEATIGEEIEITLDNYTDYLNAAKYLDLLQPEEIKQSTFALRLACLLNSNGQLKTLEAFSYRINPGFFRVIDEKGNFIPGKKLYHAGQYELRFVPEWSTLQRDIIQEVVDSVVNLSNALQFTEPHLIMFTGTFGAGKSYQTHHHPWMPDFDRQSNRGFDGVLSTDAVKRIYMLLVPGVTNGQVHHEGVALRVQVMEALYRNYPAITIVQEAVLSTHAYIDELFDLTAVNNTKIKLVDLDTDLTTACLHILCRDPKAGDPLPPYPAIVSGQKHIREARSYLLEQVQKNKYVVAYELHFFHEGELHLVAEKRQGSFSVLPNKEELFQAAQQPTNINDIEQIALRRITAEDCEVYGERLEPFVGMTIEKAFEQLIQ